MDNIKLRPFDGITIVCSLILPGLLYTGLGNLVEKNNTAAWMALVFSFVWMLCLFLITSALMKRYEGKNIIEVTAIVMGRPVAVLYAIALGVYFCYFSGVYVREGSEIVKAYGMNNTPIYVIAGLIVLTAVIMNFFGGWSIFKSAGFFFVMTLLGIVFVLLLGLNRYNPDHLVPALGNGVQNTAINSLYLTSMFDGVILLALFAPAFKNARSFRKTGVLSLIVAVAASVLLCLCYIMMFPPTIASTLISGYMEMGKSSYYNHFFYRFESILLFFLIFSTILLACLGLLIAQHSFTRSLKIKSAKVVTFIGGIFIMLIALIPSNILDLKNRYLFVLREYSVFFIAGFPVLLYIISSIKRVFKHEKV